MSIQIQIDTKSLCETIDRMIETIDHFKRVDIGAGLSDFQVDDMHRNRPFTMRSRARGTATTKIRPHSLYEMQRSAGAFRRYRRALPKYEAFIASGKKRRRKAKYVRTVEAYRPHTSARPILRAEMLATLWDRMLKLRDEKINWAAVKEK
jgi:hypothetical protein